MIRILIIFKVIKFLSILYRNSDHILHVLYFRVSVDVGYHLKRLEIGDKQKATIQLWDIPGNSHRINDENIYIMQKQIIILILLDAHI